MDWFALCWKGTQRWEKFFIFPKGQGASCEAEQGEKKLLGNFGMDGWMEYLGRGL